MRTKKIFDYETMKMTSRRAKVQHLWSSPGHEVHTYKKTKAGKVSYAGAAKIGSHAWSVPVKLEFVEAIVIDGVPAYTADEMSDTRPSSFPLSTGGRFRFIRTLSDGHTVQRTLYLSDIAEASDIRVVFGWHKKPADTKKENDHEKQASKTQKKRV